MSNQQPGEIEKWIEAAAAANSAFQIACSDAMERQGSALLTLLLGGAGGALAFAVNLAEKKAAIWQQAGTAGVALWLFAIAALLLIKVLWARPIYGPANDPANLEAAYTMPIEDARKFELQNRQFCITENRKRNEAVGFWLNACRMAAALSPIVFALSVWVVVG